MLTALEANWNRPLLALLMILIAVCVCVGLWAMVQITKATRK